MIQPISVLKGMLSELFTALGATDIWYFLSAIYTDRTETNISLFSDSRFNEIRRRAEIVADHSKGVEVCLLFGFHSHETEHINGLSVKFGNGDLASLNITAISTTGRGNPKTRPAIFEHAKHLVHGSKVLLLLYWLRFGIGIEVLLAVDAQEVATHGEGAAIPNSDRMGITCITD
jgi:hypothetical protein